MQKSRIPGQYIVEGDIMLKGDLELYAYYDHHVNGAPMRIQRLRSPFEPADPASPWLSTVYSPDGEDQVWDVTDKLELTYCVSDDFEEDYDRVVDTMHIATNDWERATHISFVHRPQYDDTCDRAAVSTDAIRFTVEPIANDGGLLGRAFFPSFPTSEWKVEITTLGLGLGTSDFRGLFRHELGHVLGLVHEHVHFGCLGSTTEDTRLLTSVDPESVMFYNDCPGSVGSNNELSRRDVLGVKQLYTLPTHQWTARFGGSVGGTVEFDMQTDYNGDGATDILFQGVNNVSDLFYGHAGQVVFGSVTSPTWSFPGMRSFPGLFSNTAGFTHDVMSYRPGSSSDYLQLSTSGVPDFSKNLRSISGIYMPLVGQFSGRSSATSTATTTPTSSGTTRCRRTARSGPHRAAATLARS